MANRPRRKCKICGEKFTPTFDNIRWCCPEHGAQYAIQLRDKDRQRQQAKKQQADRAAWRERKAAVKPLSHWMQMTQRAFNDWRRERLLAAGNGCISCGTHSAIAWHAGHYRTTAAAPQLRFNPDNIWLQCSACNVHKSGNIEAYRAVLVELIGEERVLALESNNETHRYTREELDQIRADSRAKLRELKKQEAA
ncbi:recombination protein NinG [Dickeya solani]|uniref:Recombination protein NinG n=1 Tax=Dickeya solani TaxID=1089444 RepID=A0ABU4EH52_9GAMM|nr:recombination protein NinG [Dickeya solani]MCA6999511.1 recombination protein NinG [Dickeya solani]MCZ0823875.1 recombination protein NinG [Dickeya solani]MDV6996242.1 recombination protein NinG [Dickeya solani]MDV7005363.1 recombination protein NinG [Dickeya solani]MDV7037597.1 recombination protein NinG [Dickeya solani]